MIEKMIGGFGMYSIDFGKAGYSDKKRELGFSDFAILFRTGSEGAKIAKILEEGGIPFQFANKDNMLNISGIVEIISYLKVLSAKGSLNDLDNIIKLIYGSHGDIYEGIKECLQKNSLCMDDLISGKNDPLENEGLQNLLKDIDRLKNKIGSQHVKKQISYISQHIKEIKEMVNKDKKRKNALTHLVEMSEPFGEDISDFLSTIALYTDADLYNFKAEKVSLLTMHASKGLEFPVVFITGCEKDNIPYKKPGTGEMDIEEERRLFYVALTRAKEELVLSYVKERNIFGKTLDREISPFVKDIEKTLLKYVSASKNFKPVPRKPVQLELF